jgi:amphi-Trp domain-containing protein
MKGATFTGDATVTEMTDRDVEKTYPLADFVAKLRRFADALEAGERFDIRIDGERIRVPEGAIFSIEHEREGGEEEIEFQVKWTLAAAAEGDDDEEEEADDEEDDEAEESDKAGEAEEEDDEADEEEAGEAEETRVELPEKAA